MRNPGLFGRNFLLGAPVPIPYRAAMIDGCLAGIVPALLRVVGSRMPAADGKVSAR
jgi:hypothetical protein